MRRPRRSTAGFCIAVLTIAALVPGLAALDAALAEPLWLLLPDDTPIAFHVCELNADEQPAPLLSLLSSRGPPSLPLA